MEQKRFKYEKKESKETEKLNTHYRSKYSVATGLFGKQEIMLHRAEIMELALE